jgi:hypothetical protein
LMKLQPRKRRIGGCSSRGMSGERSIARKRNRVKVQKEPSIPIYSAVEIVGRGSSQPMIPLTSHVAPRYTPMFGHTKGHKDWLGMN